MKRLIMTACLLLCWSSAAAITEDTLQFGRFGTVHLYEPDTNPSSIVLFVSGDGGWNLGVVDMARSLVPLGALVIGIDIVSLFERA